NIQPFVSKGERVGACLVVCAIGVSLIPVYAVVGVPVALVAAIVAIWEARRTEVVHLSDDQIARAAAALRLREFARTAREMARGSDNDGNFRTNFYGHWGGEMPLQAMATHLEARFGLMVRDTWLYRGPHLNQLDAFVAAL